MLVGPGDGVLDDVVGDLLLIEQDELLALPDLLCRNVQQRLRRLGPRIEEVIGRLAARLGRRGVGAEQALQLAD